MLPGQCDMSPLQSDICIFYSDSLTGQKSCILFRITTCTSDTLNFFYKIISYVIDCGPYTFFVFLGRWIKHKWENCLSIDKYSWGYRRTAKISDYMSIESLLSQLASTVRYIYCSSCVEYMYYTVVVV